MVLLDKGKDFAALLLAVCLLWISAPPAVSQPFDLHDPFYQNESARRAFFDNYALSAQLSYPSSGVLQNERVIDPALIGFSFRADYQVAPQVDVGAIIDASGGSGGRRLSLSWLVLKYYRHVKHERADYALRLAVDPRANGRVGFPQVDVAFIYTSLLSPFISSDFAIGFRRVRMGYRELVSTDNELNPLDVIYRRAMGWELHAMTSYSMLLNPTGSNVFVALSGDLSQFDIVELNLSEPAGDAAARVAPGISYGMLPGPAMLDGDDDPSGGEDLADEEGAIERDYRGGVIWLRAGLTYSRPAYQVRPYVAVPVRQWRPESFEGGRGRALLHAGLRFTLR